MSKSKKTKPLDNQSRPHKIEVPPLLKSAHEDLLWFFQEGESSCSITSNYQAFLYAMVNHCSIESAEEQLLDCLDKHRTQDQIFKSVSKYRKINDLFNQLETKDQRILELFYYEQQFDRSLEAHFGAGLKLVPLTKSFQKLPPQWQNLQKLQYCLIHERKLIDKMKSEVYDMYLQVLTKYEDLRNG